jgi:methionine synthase I (cobalamin-dependent)
MGTELERRGVPMDADCWSGMAVLESPDKVRQVHEDFIRAGAEVIITNTFSTGRHMLDPAGAGEHVSTINTNAVRLAKEAIDNAASTPVAIAGSMCEWTSAQDHPKWSKPKSIADALAEQAKLMAEAGADIICIEMAQNLGLSTLAMKAALATGLPVWLGISCRKNQITKRLTTFDDASEDFHAFADAVSNMGAGLLNLMHTPVPDVEEGLGIMAKIWNGPLGVYPESGFFKMPNWQFVDVIAPDVLVEAAKPWVENHGIRVLGGCCGIQPDHIRALKNAFD